MIYGLILAFQFLTRIPIPINVPFTNQTIKKSIFFFPLVGFVIGLLLEWIHILIIGKPFILGFISTVLWVAITGGMHLDGVADTFDGFFSGKKKEKILAIMEDSQIGSFGVLPLIFIILGKVLLLSTITFPPLYLPVICAGARLANTYIIALFPNARPGGMGDMFKTTKPLPYIIFSTMIFLLFLIYTKTYAYSILLGQFLFVLLFSLYSKFKIDGVTGDIYGANVEFAELVGLLIWGLIR